MKTREDMLLKKYPEIHKKILDYSEPNKLTHLPFKIQVWHFINQLPTVPKCLQCNKELNFKRSLNEGYGIYCSISCTNKDSNHIDQVRDKWKEKEVSIKEKMKKTTQEKYGVDNYFQRTDLIKKSFQEKHGVTNVSQVPGVREKIEKTTKEKYGTKSVLSLPENYKKSHSIRREEFREKYKNLKINNDVGNHINITCDKCKNDYNIYRPLLYIRHKNKIETCTVCNPKNSQDSYHEKEVVSFIDSLEIPVIENDRKLISPKEIDIILPKHNIAIEFNGIYWHSELFVEKNYHLNKTKSCESNGYDLIHIFQDEWIEKREVVKSIIKNKIGLVSNRVFGRKCVIKEITPTDSKKFLTENHIQGHVNSSIKIGLYYNGELISLMTFGKNRKSLGQTHKEGEWEMLRFCNKLNTTVIGAASKLFKYFITTYTPQKITSYSDNRYFSGGLYGKLGFQYSHDTKPNYFYIINQKRKNRFNFRKDKLISEGYDKTMSEHEIMLDRGIYRIYDCGNKKWVWNKE